MADLLGVLGVLGAGNRVEGNQNQGQGPRRGGWKKDDCSKSKSWDKSRGHKKACKH